MWKLLLVPLGRFTSIDESALQLEDSAALPEVLADCELEVGTKLAAKRTTNALPVVSWS